MNELKKVYPFEWSTSALGTSSVDIRKKLQDVCTGPWICWHEHKLSYTGIVLMFELEEDRLRAMLTF